MTEQIVNGVEVERMRDLAEQVTPVAQVCRVFHPCGETAAVVTESGRVIARGLRLADAQFFAEGPRAVIELCNEVSLLKAYVEYVSISVELAGIMFQNGLYEKMLPMTYDVWVAMVAKGMEP
jgi:hypothetical protein